MKKSFITTDPLQIDKEQAELARANFSILRKEAQAILDLVGALSTQPLSTSFFLQLVSCIKIGVNFEVFDYIFFNMELELRLFFLSSIFSQIDVFFQSLDM